MRFFFTHRFAGLCYTFTFICLLLTGSGEAQVFVAERPTETLLFRSGGFATGDYDNDSLPDLFLMEHWRSTIALLHNEGNGRFTDQTAIIQLDIPGTKFGGAAFGDYDHDGDLDLFVPVWDAPSRLLRNDRGRFVDATIKAGLPDGMESRNAVWLDYNRDGDLDLNVQVSTSSLGEVANTLYRNNGDGTFTDVSKETGLNLRLRGGINNGGVVAADFSGDGWPDLYIGIEQEPNRLFLNTGQGRFVDATTDEIGDPGTASGVTIGDIDNDGDLEIFQATNPFVIGIFEGDETTVQFRSFMLLNLGEGLFLDATEGVGLVPQNNKFISEPLRLADMDNDGDLDLLTGSSVLKPGGLFEESHFFFVNGGDGTFVDRTTSSGLRNVGGGLSFGDYNGDGSLDVIFGCCFSSSRSYFFSPLYVNTGNARHYLQVELVGTESDRNGIGSRLIMTAGDLRQMREILGGLGNDQDELVAHFGLGEHALVERLEIHWPSGQVDALHDVPVDQKIRVVEGREEYYVVHPPLWENTFPDTVVIGEKVELMATVQPALFEPGAEIKRVSADFSNIGGPGTVPLEEGEEGIYRLETTAFEVESSIGFQTISILIEQVTSLGPYWTSLSKDIYARSTQLPTEDLVIFADELAENGRIVDSQGELDFRESTVVYEGQFSLAISSLFGYPFVTYRLTHPVDPAGYRSLHFAFHPPNTSEESEYSVRIEGIIGRSIVPIYSPFVALEEPLVDPDLKVWQVVEIPLPDFTGLITEISFHATALDFQTEQIDDTFYLDDIRLATVGPHPSNTAVTGEHTVALPQTFSLDQNYPNPFNSATVIRFALPTSGDVELSIFNLAGQQVATLVKGAREVGAYTVSWDGRDDDGRELASGVYLYRLRVGQQQVETRKLVLVR